MNSILSVLTVDSARPGLRRLEERLTSVGQEGKMGEVEDNEEPDSDEEVMEEHRLYWCQYRSGFNLLVSMILTCCLGPRYQ